jgi:hypothetical protein
MSRPFRFVAARVSLIGLGCHWQRSAYALRLLAVRARLAQLPRGITAQIVATGFLAGIGFTVALFVASLAFSDPGHARCEGRICSAPRRSPSSARGTRRTLPHGLRSRTISRENICRSIFCC